MSSTPEYTRTTEQVGDEHVVKFGELKFGEFDFGETVTPWTREAQASDPTVTED